MLSQSNYDALSSFRNHPIRMESGATEQIDYLVSQGYLKPIRQAAISIPGAFQIYDVEWKITIPGLNALHEFEKEHQKQTQAERQQRFQNKISVASVLIPLVTFFLGLIVEHYAGIVGFVFSLFH